MDFEPLRLHPGDDLREALAARCRTTGINGFVVSGIGSLSRACLRLAGAEASLALDGPLEILSLAGSLCGDGVHLHAALADAQGRVSGGHVAAGCIVRTTAELLLATLPAGRLSRVFDAATGYPELRITTGAPR